MKLVKTLGIAMGIAILLMGFQNCGDYTPEHLAKGTNSGSNGGGSNSGISPDVLAPSNDAGLVGLISADKAMGNTTTKTTITYDLGSEVQDGTPIPGTKITIDVIKFIPPDGSQDSYLISKPVIITGAKAVQLKSIHVRINGVTNDIATTFSGVDLTVPPNTTLTLSGGTLVHQLKAPASSMDKLGLFIDKFWEDGVPLPAPTPGGLPAGTGAKLYTDNCAACHGSLSISVKRGRDANAILGAIQARPEMTYLQGKFTANEIAAIVDALK